MTYCITSRRGTNKLLELVPNPFDDINKICSKQNFLLLLPVGARFPDCDFFNKSEIYMSVIVTCHNLHVCVLYY